MSRAREILLCSVVEMVNRKAVHLSLDALRLQAAAVHDLVFMGPNTAHDRAVAFAWGIEVAARAGAQIAPALAVGRYWESELEVAQRASQLEQAR